MLYLQMGHTRAWPMLRKDQARKGLAGGSPAMIAGVPMRLILLSHFPRTILVRCDGHSNSPPANRDQGRGGLGRRHQQSGAGPRFLFYQSAAAQAVGLFQMVLHTWEPDAVPVSMVYDEQGAMPTRLRPT